MLGKVVKGLLHIVAQKDIMQNAHVDFCRL